MDSTQADQTQQHTGAEPSPDPQDFTLNVYKGCVLPEDYRPVRTISWSKWVEENPDDYSPEQLALIQTRLLAGRSWVCFVIGLVTISAPDFYKRQPPYNNPVQPKAKLP